MDPRVFLGVVVIAPLLIIGGVALIRVPLVEQQHEMPQIAPEPVETPADNGADLVPADVGRQLVERLGRRRSPAARRLDECRGMSHAVEAAMLGVSVASVKRWRRQGGPSVSELVSVASA